MSQIFGALGIIFPMNSSVIKRKVRKFDGEVVIGYRGKKYIFSYEDGSYILKTSDRVKKMEIETLASIISSSIGMTPICFYDVREEKNKAAVTSAIEWNGKNPDSILSAKIARMGCNKLVLYPGTETYLIKVTGINSFNPVLFGNPLFKDFKKRINTCEQFDLYLIIDILSRYCTCLKEGTWDGPKIDITSADLYYQTAVVATKRFISPFESEIDETSADQIYHTKEFTNWKNNCKEYFESSEYVHLYFRKRDKIKEKRSAFGK